MANSRFEYVKSFEQDDTLLPHCWIVIRIDGKGFTKFSDAHEFEKPNDERALHLMNAAAVALMEEQADIVLAFGQSDEYSFVLKKKSDLYNRRSSKLISVFVSFFTAAYVLKWREHFPEMELRSMPAFDARAVCYPSDEALRDYMSWRQADCHINNQYNTCFWGLVHKGHTKRQAQDVLKGTLTNDKNEIMFNTLGINYAHLPPLHRKGSVVVRGKEVRLAKTKADGTAVYRERAAVRVLHEDLISPKFWAQHAYILGGKAGETSKQDACEAPGVPASDAVASASESKVVLADEEAEQEERRVDASLQDIVLDDGRALDHCH